MDISSLKKSERELNETVNEMNTFIYMASHDLKTPLSSMEGLINLAEKEIKSPESTLYLQMINTCVKKMNNMLTNLTSIIMTSISFCNINFQLRIFKDTTQQHL